MKNNINEVLIINTYHHIKFYGDFIFRFTNCIRTLLWILSSKFVSHICCSWQKYCAQILATTKYIHEHTYQDLNYQGWIESCRASLCWGPGVCELFGPSSSRTTATRVKHRVELISERCKHGHKLHILLCEIPISCPNPRLYCHLTHLSKPKRTVS